ncbi:hypothetical protein EVAR_25116_1 [Eumeta japonica]|uniref:Uncharacterized protein n=1 Tax=Eumeta variegata TaxID=151549 RepID=A0A4C1XP35_EUMVA|nr:hypothetical protein EVAR_25116_1 [Eumeta japonica]
MSLNERRPAESCVSLPLNYDRSAALSKLVHSLPNVLQVIKSLISLRRGTVSTGDVFGLLVIRLCSTAPFKVYKGDKERLALGVVSLQRDTPMPFRVRFCHQKA